MRSTAPSKATQTAPHASAQKKRLLFARAVRMRPSATQLIETALPRYQINLDSEAETDIAPDSWFDTNHASNLGGNSGQDFALEIGFGGGEQLSALAARHPKRGFIGCEPFLPGVAKILAVLEAQKLTNVRLYQGDGRDVLDALAANTLAAVYVLYPDPWHKRRHHKRRFINDDNLAAIHRALAPDGVLVFVSDHAPYVDWTLAHVWRHGGFQFLAETADDWRQPPAGWVATRYEAKAARAARKSAYLRFKKREV